MGRDLKSGVFDIAIGGVSVTLDRQKTGFFSAPYLRDGKTPIAPCGEADRFQTLEAIDRPGVRVIVNPSGGNERFDHARLHAAEIIASWPALRRPPTRFGRIDWPPLRPKSGNPGFTVSWVRAMTDGSA